MDRPLFPEVFRALDAGTIDAGFPGILLMEAAGFASFRLAQRICAARDIRSVVVVTGSGNNAGDGFVLARHAAAAGLAVRVLGLRDADRFPEGSDARRNAEWLRLYEIALEPLPRVAPIESVEGTLVVDALLGTGSIGAPREDTARAIDWIRGHRGPVLALDLPSGLCPRAGLPLGDRAVVATHTVTFGGVKSGLLRGRGPEHSGLVTVVPLPFPPDVQRRVLAEFGVRSG